VTRLDHEGEAHEGSEPEKEAPVGRVEQVLHYSHRIPAPVVSAIAPRSMSVHVRRPRIVFTEFPFLCPLLA
jgi:hypothetical protein